MTGKEIVSQIEAWREDIPYRYFYIGITDNIQERLFNYHQPDSGHNYFQADTEEIARSVERYFLKKGMQGDTGGGKQPIYVYVYLISPNTKE